MFLCAVDGTESPEFDGGVGKGDWYHLVVVAFKKDVYRELKRRYSLAQSS